MKNLLILFCLLPVIGWGQTKADTVKPWYSAPIKYAIEYNWFPDDNELVHAFYTTGFPCKIRDWLVIPSNTFWVSGDNPLLSCDLKIKNVAKARDKHKHGYLTEYNYHFAAWAKNDGMEFDITRDSAENKRIDSLIKLECKF